MMRRTIRESLSLGAGAGDGARCLQVRSVTTQGQFNPIHNFSHSIALGSVAKDKESFVKLITNPGPLQVAYSPDYLDWLFRAYTAKVKYEQAKLVAEKKFQGHLISNDSGGRKDLTSPPRGLPGMFLRPEHSIRRRAGSATRQAAQQVVDEAARQHGMLDLFERQPQFPAIYIERCTRFHLIELFKELILRRALTAAEVWEKALLYRAILSERRASYPPSFTNIFRSVEDVVLARRRPLNPSDPKSEVRLVDGDKFPTAEAYLYFLSLVKKYFVQNGVEAHVVLRCHRHPKAAEILFSNPPPKDDEELKKSMAGHVESLRKTEAGGEEEVVGSEREGQVSASSLNYTTAPDITSYPPLEALWLHEENEPLLRVLLFGELNLIVSDNPFVKFPSAHSHLTRPYSSEHALGGSGAGSGSEIEGVSLASIIAEARGGQMAPIAYNLVAALDSRAHDVRRLQQRHHRDDISAVQKLRRGPDADENPAVFSSYTDLTYFNPRAVRAEERDRITQKVIQAIKAYDAGTHEMYRRSVEEALSANASRCTETLHHVPATIPTVPHFLALILKDTHVSFLKHVGLPRGASQKELQRLAFYLAKALFHMALDFSKEDVRRVNRQKVAVAAAMLDSFVQEQWVALIEKHSQDGAHKEAGASLPEGVARTQDGIVGMARRLGDYVPFAGRMLDEAGFPSDARFDDYMRWISPKS